MKLYRAEYKFLDGDTVVREYADFVGDDFYSILSPVTNAINEIGECELTGIREILVDGKPVNIVNYVEPDCECPYCRANRVPLDMVASFPCPNCGKQVVVAENGWESIPCNDCSTDLHRHLISRSKTDGKWYYKKEEDNEDES